MAPGSLGELIADLARAPDAADLLGGGLLGIRARAERAHVAWFP